MEHAHQVAAHSVSTRTGFPQRVQQYSNRNGSYITRRVRSKMSRFEHAHHNHWCTQTYDYYGHWASQLQRESRESVGIAGVSGHRGGSGHRERITTFDYIKIVRKHQHIFDARRIAVLVQLLAVLSQK